MENAERMHVLAQAQIKGATRLEPISFLLAPENVSESLGKFLLGSHLPQRVQQGVSHRTRRDFI